MDNFELQMKAKMDKIGQMLENKQDFVFLGKLGGGNVLNIKQEYPNMISIPLHQIRILRDDSESGMLGFLNHTIQKMSSARNSGNPLLLIDEIYREERPENVLEILNERKISSIVLPENFVIGFYASANQFGLEDELIDDASVLVDLLDKNLEK